MRGPQYTTIHFITILGRSWIAGWIPMYCTTLRLVDVPAYPQSFLLSLTSSRCVAEVGACDGHLSF